MSGGLMERMVVAQIPGREMWSLEKMAYQRNGLWHSESCFPDHIDLTKYLLGKPSHYHCGESRVARQYWIRHHDHSRIILRATVAYTPDDNFQEWYRFQVMS